VLEIVKRSDKRKGFQVLPPRWVVERTFGWLNPYRRLAKDYERCCPSDNMSLFCHKKNLACLLKGS
jgi:transposase